MSAGLAALLDDVAALAKAAAASVDDVGAAAGKATAKATGVVVDDTAVTPRYVEGIEPKRELPVIWRIARGSLVNKILIILPVALVLSQFAPWLLTPILMLGGTYLCFEGAEKVWEMVAGHAENGGQDGERASEDQIAKGAIRTDLILSAEIMVISLNEVSHEPLLARTLILLVVAVVITLLVYGVVGLIVKMDDIGLALARRDSRGAQRFGRGLVTAMPRVLSVISLVGVFAMLWVGGHIMLQGLDTLGLHAPFELVHHLEEAVHGVAGVGGFLAWLVETLCSLVLGLVWGGVVFAVVHAVRSRRHRH
ncbi:DUF808 domain-containing protein [Arthrobacter sp. UM1]|uniref:DUF808 domain-containing protein n=1 Tax=Arthrobacter sp. UM1 TaxID=2766776 RepID=UPI001CF69468|nr:DUF808 domain-containing protein [Arthrobacter sp. UM1]MCB4208123.1 DUF808 domain-containing protein [Arthrobacter sp. UM1]